MSGIINIADLFCGAGGTSTGAIQALHALGFDPHLTAINHWDMAIATHHANHPEGRALCTNLDDVDPRKLFKPGELDILWASPECTHHSVARGGRPINDQSRSTAWAVIRWAEALQPDVILVENVPEFQTWGGLDAHGRPLKTKKGATFGAWVAALRSLGYRVDWRILCAADYGDPTTRRRLFVQAVRGRRKIVWPNPTHAPKPEVGLFDSVKPWKTAREIIDWGLEGESIFERKRPLALKTLKRIEAGLRKYGLNGFLVPGYNEREGQSPRTHSFDAPVPTVAATGHTHLVSAFLVPGKTGSETRSIDKPLQTVTCEARGERLIQPFLVEMRGTSERQVECTNSDCEHPIGTITAGGGHHGLVEPFLVTVNHGEENKGGTAESRCMPIGDPLGTVTCKNGSALVSPFIVSWDNQSSGRGFSGPDEPITTITTKARHGVAEAMLIQQQSGGVARPVSQPVPTVSTAGAISLVQPFLVEYYGQGGAQSVDDPMPTATTKQRFGLVRPVVEIDGERYQLDIRFRMLQPHELAAAQGFPRDYQFAGNKTEIVKQIGNAVPCGLARALVAAAWSQKNDVTAVVAKAAEAVA